MTTTSMEVVLTGTGTPIPVPGRAGPGVYVRTADAGLQIDTGRATVLRLAEAGVRADAVDAVLLTHHHSDHTTDLGDVLVSAWLMDADHAVDLVAPAGLTAEFAETALAPLRGDMTFRRGHRRVTDIARPDVRAFRPGRAPALVWQRGDTQVDAVAVRHEPVVDAVGYRIRTSLGSVVISGDTRACAEIEELASGARVLVHEVVDPARVPEARRHTIEYHAIPAEVGALAERAGVETLVLTHLWPAPQDDLDIRAFHDGVRAGGFTGELIVGADLVRLRVTPDATLVTLPATADLPALHTPSLREPVAQH